MFAVGRLTLAAMTVVAIATLPANTISANSGVKMPHPQPFVVRADAASMNAACETCHSAIAAEWRTSLHAQADVDPVYRRALAIEPMPFCRGCHAPEADPTHDAAPRVSAIGVGCITCHVPEAGHDAPILASPQNAAGAHEATGAAHPVMRDARFATAAACASCHEFNFPDVALRRVPERMQSTISEHASSSSSRIPCETCHMPRIKDTSGSHKSHVFTGGRDANTVRASLRIHATRTSATHARITLVPEDVGHAVPTGDLFRRLLITAEAVGDDFSVAGQAERSLSRKFALKELAPGYRGRVLTLDDRVRGPRDVDLDLGDDARDLPIVWRVEYQRVEHPIDASDHVVVADSLLVAEGRLEATMGEGSP